MAYGCGGGGYGNDGLNGSRYIGGGRGGYGLEGYGHGGGGPISNSGAKKGICIITYLEHLKISLN